MNPMNERRDPRRPGRMLMQAIAVALLVAGPVLNVPDAGEGGSVEARGRGGGGAKGSGRPSRVDRAPRSSSAQRGSIGGANRDAARSKRPTNTTRPTQERATAVSRDTPVRRGATAAKRPQSVAVPRDRADLNRKLQTHEVSRGKVAGATGVAGVSAGRSDIRQNPELRRSDIENRRKEYSGQREDIRKDRQENMEEIRENRREYLDAAREDRQDFMQDLADQRQDMWEDVYDDHHYWGDWDDDDDDDDEWLWGIVGGVAGYAIGAAVNSPPEGTVAVPYGGTNYQYYGGAFYQPAPSGQGYQTAPAPVGAAVEAPPLDCTIVFGPTPEDPGYCYFQGAFFVYDEGADQYVVAQPKVGTEVPYLPGGYRRVTVEGVEYLEIGGIRYRPYIAGDDEVFVVSRV